jgi:hypothetical protein
MMALGGGEIDNLSATFISRVGETKTKKMRRLSGWAEVEYRYQDNIHGPIHRIREMQTRIFLKPQNRFEEIDQSRVNGSIFYLATLE